MFFVLEKLSGGACVRVDFLPVGFLCQFVLPTRGASRLRITPPGLRAPIGDFTLPLQDLRLNVLLQTPFTGDEHSKHRAT